jgi:adenine-specific DNA-methyltransferase
MTSINQKLELSWLGKGEDLNLEPRLLLLQPEHCVGSPEADNMLIHGDNLLALKALEQHYAGKVKCIYIDPPYNTGNAFEHYDDMQEHSLWLNLMFHRLVLLKNLLHTEGSIWVTLDDNEVHYCKVMMDEIFGRANFIGNVVWQHSIQGKNDSKTFSLHHNHILVYSKTNNFQIGRVPRQEKHNIAYSNPDNDPKGFWRSGDVRSPNYRENLMYDVKTPSGKIIKAPDKGWRWSKELLHQKIEIKEIIFSKNEEKLIRKIYLDGQDDRVAETIWFGEDVGTTREANKHIKDIFIEDVFGTPKPERLIERVLTLATKEGDLVLDSFLGSGTTAAVAHKMGRKWIGIELGEHAYTHCLPRLRKVVEGSDQGGISKAVDWKGGGGFKVYKLAESLLERDEKGMLHINPDFTNEMVAEAVAKIEGYTYNPTPALYWQQGEGLDKSYLYVTKIFISRAWLDQLAEQVPEDVSLMVCCPAYTEGCDRAYKHIKLKKIPQAFQDAYDFDKGDYSLQVENVMPMEEEEVENGENTEGPLSMKKRSKNVVNKQVSMF